MVEELTHHDFDYASLEIASGDARTLEKHAKAVETIQERVRRVSAEGVLKIGEELAAAQERLANHRIGTFQKWCKQRLGMSLSSVYRAIASHSTFANCVTVTQFDCNAMYLLSAESTPEEATAKALKLAESGERITHKRAKEIVAEFRNSESQTDGGSVEPSVDEWDWLVAFDEARQAIGKLRAKWPTEYLDALANFLISEGQSLHKEITNDGRGNGDGVASAELHTAGYGEHFDGNF